MGRFLRVGLTGGLASGKSTVLEVFAQEGARVADADAFAREALRPSTPVYRAVIDAFGHTIVGPDGSLDRAKLAALVFTDRAARDRLEELIHPEVIRREEEWIERIEQGGDSGILVVDAALMIEAGRASRYDVLVVVACPVEEQVRRAVARGMNEEDARRRIESQLPLDRKAAQADHIIDSSGTLEETRRQARALYRRLRAEAEAGD